ncbi:MAG: hypothetical protein HY717_24290 [Planctomycetes bacterium]|nr:hypothetical protein [Planctomycetota bacterium]
MAAQMGVAASGCDLAAGVESAAGDSKPKEQGKDKVAAGDIAQESQDPAGIQDKTERDFSMDCQATGCHAQMLLRPKNHKPAALGACRLCHRATGAQEDHRFNLIRDKKELCSFCHSPAPPEKFQHEPYVKGDCLKCHDPHGSTSSHLLLGKSAGDACQTCHNRQPLKHNHPPVAGGDCNACHETHQSREPHLLRSSEKELCIACHEDILADAAKAQSIHGVFQEQWCTGCHTAHTSDFEKLLVDRQVNLCLCCHDREIEVQPGKVLASIQDQLSSALYLHGPLKEGKCSPCHHPHFSEHRTLLRGNYPDSPYVEFSSAAYEICFTCHEERNFIEERTRRTGFRDGDRNLHYLHVNRTKGRRCAICHENHGSKNLKLVRQDFPFGDEEWKLPINYVATKTGGMCDSACHKTASYKNSD